jgi:hypothetical protein
MMMKSNPGKLSLLSVVVFVMLACGLGPLTTSPSSDVQTQIAAGIQATLAARGQATNPAAPENSTLPADLAKKMDLAKILVYEDVAGDPSLTPYVKTAIASLPGDYTYMGDAMGNFMDKLTSDTPWDLIIMAAEMRETVSGGYWDLINDQVNKKVGLVAEMWYLDQINRGKISPFLEECGIGFQKNWDRSAGANKVEYGMFWSVPDSPVFNSPNEVGQFKWSLNYWTGDAGDFVSLSPGSNAVILASHGENNTHDYGLITSCLDGRVILQTFSSHDYPSDAMVALWQNYITYTLSNHFKALP